MFTHLCVDVIPRLLLVASLNFDIENWIEILDHTHHIPTSSTQPISILTTTNSLCHYAASRNCNSNRSSFSGNFTNNRSR